MKQTIIENYKFYRIVKKKIVNLARIDIGGTYVTLSYLLKGDRPFCVGCHSTFTEEHILAKCIDFYQIRSRHYQESDLKHLFELVNLNDNFGFLKE